ncbi:MAG: hypothetical protein IIB67_07985 [Proteobacteria bacterium]|nr:hypothetical protein [Pseudomonadota bacterium]
MPAATRKTDRRIFNKVIGVAPAQLKLIRYIDGQGKDEVRLAIKSGGRHYLLRESIGTDMLLQKCQPWVEEGIARFAQGGEVPPEHEGLTAAEPEKETKKTKKAKKSS